MNEATCPTFIAAPFIWPSTSTICSAASIWRRSRALRLASSERTTSAARPDPAEVLVFLMATDSDGTPVGAAALCASGEAAEIKRLYVRPHARGRGVGGALLDRLEREAAGRGYGAVRLETGLRQPEAIRLYERRGYRTIENFGVYADSSLARSYERELG